MDDKTKANRALDLMYNMILDNAATRRAIRAIEEVIKELEKQDDK